MGFYWTVGSDMPDEEIIVMRPGFCSENPENNVEEKSKGEDQVIINQGLTSIKK